MNFGVTVHPQPPAWLAEIPLRDRYVSAQDQVALAIELARQNVERDLGGPFGAAVFDAQGHVVSLGVNRVLPEGCSLAHAEIMAYLAAQARLGRARLNETGAAYTLATSAQPCCQCYGATIWVGIDHLRIGARSSDVMELTEFDEGPLPADWVGELERRGIAVQRDIERETARQVLSSYRERGGTFY